MNKEFKNTTQAVGKQELIDHLCSNVSELVQMHYGLIQLYEEESYLKRHHKAYLHVRDKADEICRRDISRMGDLMYHTLEMIVAVKEAEEKAAAAKEPAQGKSAAEDMNKDFKKDILTHLSCEGCPYQEECEKEGVKEYQMETNEHPEENKIDVFALPEGRVYMSTKTLGVMQDDMLALTDGIDHLIYLFRALMRGEEVEDEIILEAIDANAELSEDVFDRWDRADMVRLS